MDGASKFVRGDAIAGLIITAVNIFGGIVIGVTRHDMSLGAAADVFTKLSVGDGLVTQIPALIVSLAAGLLVSKGGTRGSTEKAVFGQLGNYPRALLLAGARHVRAGAGARPAASCPSRCSARMLLFIAYAIPKRRAEVRAAEEAKVREADTGGRGGGPALRSRTRSRPPRSSSASASSSRPRCSTSHGELAHRVGQDAPQVRQPVRLRRAGDQAHRRSRHRRRRPTRSRSTAPSPPARQLRIGDVLVITGDGAAARRARRGGARAGLRHEGDVGAGDVRRRTSSARASSPSTTCRCCSPTCAR